MSSCGDTTKSVNHAFFREIILQILTRYYLTILCVSSSRPTTTFVSQYDWLQEKLYCQDSGYFATHEANQIVRQNQSQRWDQSNDGASNMNNTESEALIQVHLEKPNGSETDDPPPSFEEAVKL